MKINFRKPSLKRILAGVLTGAGLISGLMWYVFINSAFPALWKSAETLCVEEIIAKPFISREQTISDFKGCLIRRGARAADVYIVPAGTIEEIVG